MWDSRGDVAHFYDLAPHHPHDVPFYIDRCPSRDAKVLELGCGTGRVTLPLSSHCHSVVGIDSSEAMLRTCGEKVEASFVNDMQVTLVHGDITDFDLGIRFDYIIAPFRVIQNLATDQQFDGLLASIRRHLGEDGRCILNAFCPRLGKEEIMTSWTTTEPTLAWSVGVAGGRVECHDHRLRVTDDPLVLHPELTYRYVGTDGQLIEQAVLTIAMRCFYPEEFVARIESAGFRVSGRWGGYAGEPYGEGSELVLEFQNSAQP